MRSLKQKTTQVMAGTIAAITLGMSGTAAADPYWRDDGYRDYGRHHRHHERYCPEFEPRVVEQNYYYYPPEGRGEYAPPPRVVYYAPPVVQYSAPAYTNYESNYGSGYGYSGGYGGSGYAPRGNRLMSSAVLGAAGGFLGNQVGHGDGRAAATAAGAVAGWVLGGNLGQ